jgi:hypothetical protein
VLRKTFGRRIQADIPQRASAVVLDGEALAALATTAGEHCLTILRPHPDEEAVRALATPVIGLKGTLHDCLTL